MDFRLFISLLSFTLVSSLKLICFCTKDDTGEILILKNAAAPFQYSMPEVRSVSKLYHIEVLGRLPMFGLNGYVSKIPLFYTSPKDRRENPNRSKFMRVRVRTSHPVPGVHDVEKIWVNFDEVGNYIKDHPNGDYKLFYEYIYNHPQIVTDPIWKKIVIICTDDADQTLFVKNKKGLYSLPEGSFRIKKTRSGNQSLAYRILRRYGIYGTIHEKIWEMKRNDHENIKVLELGFHAIVYGQRKTGVGYVVPKPTNVHKKTEVIRYGREDRIWLNPVESRKILQPSAYLEAFEGVMSSNSWRLLLRNSSEMYPNGMENTGSTNSNDQVFGNYQGDSSVMAANNKFSTESEGDEIYEDFYKTLEMLEID